MTSADVRGRLAHALRLDLELQLKSLGYTDVASLHRVMKNSKNAPLYRLVFASHSPRGLDFWKKISAIDHDGQRGLF